MNPESDAPKPVDLCFPWQALPPDTKNGRQMLQQLEQNQKRPIERRCNSCGISFPLTQFRKRSKNSTHRHRECRKCHAHAVRQWRRKQREDSLQKELSAYVRSSSQSPHDEKIRELTVALIDSFGGIEALVKAWTDNIRAMPKTISGMKEKNRYYETIIRLLQHID